ncbi:urocanate hydratase [Tachysurus ichikawai]
MINLKELCRGLPLDPLPPNHGRDPDVPHAPIRTPNLTAEEKRLALRNALRYFPQALHASLAPEFAQELKQYGHIYMYRFCPSLRMRAYPIDQYPCKTRHAAAIMHMIMNNLDPAVAQVLTHPHSWSSSRRETKHTSHKLKGLLYLSLHSPNFMSLSTRCVCCTDVL